MNTKREKPVVEVDGYLMRQHKPDATGLLMFWRCSGVNKYKCNARGSSLVDSLEVAMTAGHSGHLADPSLATKYRVNTQVKAAAKANILVPSGQLVDHHTSGLTGEELNKLARRSGIQKVINRARKHAEGSAVDRSPEHVRFTRFFKRTKDDQQFLRIDSRQTEPNMPVFFAFASPSGLAQLQRERRYSMDEFASDYSERTYIRRFNARGVLVDPLFPIPTWNVHVAVLEDGARTNNSQEGWNRAFNQRFLRSKMKLSQFLLRLREEEEQARQRIEKAAAHPADAFRQRRRAKTIIRDGNIKALVEEYVALPAAQRNRAAMADLLDLIQNHLSA